MKKKRVSTFNEADYELRIDPVTYAPSFWQRKTDTEYFEVTQEKYFKACSDRLDALLKKVHFILKKKGSQVIETPSNGLC